MKKKTTTIMLLSLLQMAIMLYALILDIIDGNMIDILLAIIRNILIWVIFAEWIRQNKRDRWD